MSGSHLESVLKVFGGCLEGVWKGSGSIFGKGLESVWKMERFLNGSDSFLEVV